MEVAAVVDGDAIELGKVEVANVVWDLVDLAEEVSASIPVFEAFGAAVEAGLVEEVSVSTATPKVVYPPIAPVKVGDAVT